MWQPVLMICGYFISLLGIAMLFPAALDIYENQVKWSIFISSSIVAIFIGLSLFLANRGKIKDISIQQAYLVTAFSWVSVTILASLPFVFYGTDWSDALFEAASGISTTGICRVQYCCGGRCLMLWAVWESSSLLLQCCRFWELAECKFFKEKIQTLMKNLCPR